MLKFGEVQNGLVQKILLIAVSVMLVQSCGFKLRGSVMVDPSLYPIYIQSESNVTQIVNPLKSALEQQNATIVDNPAQAVTIIELLTEQFSRRVLTVSNKGKVQEYALNYFVEIKIVNSEGKELLDKTRIEVERDLRFDDSEVLAKSTEETSIHQHMLEDTVQQLLRRLQSLRPRNNISG